MVATSGTEIDAPSDSDEYKGAVADVVVVLAAGAYMVGDTEHPMLAPPCLTATVRSIHLTRFRLAVRMDSEQYRTANENDCGIQRDLPVPRMTADVDAGEKTPSRPVRVGEPVAMPSYYLQQ